MEDSPDKQIETELRNATERAAPNKPRTSTGKLRKPTSRQQRPVMTAMKPRKTGANKNLRRLEGGPSRDTFDPISSPERGKPRSKPALDGPISPRRDDVRHVAPQSMTTERQAIAGAGPVLTAPIHQRSTYRPPQKRSPEPAAAKDVSPEVEDVLLEEEEQEVPGESSPIANHSSQALANAVENETNAGNSNGHDQAPIQETAQDLETAIYSTKAEPSKRKTRKSRSSKPVGSAARKPASSNSEPASSPQVVLPPIKKIRPGSIYPISPNEQTSEIASDEGYQRPTDRRLNGRLRVNHIDPESDDNQTSEAESEQHEIPQRSRKRKVVTTLVASQPSKTAQRPNRPDDLGQKYELFGLQPKLLEVYQTVREIGWSYKDGEKHRRFQVDLDDEQIIALKKLCGEAKYKLSGLKDHADSDDEDLESDPPEELRSISNQVQRLRTKEEYFRDENKVNNIYFHLFASLVGLLRHTIDCYGEIDKHDDELTPHRAITIRHLGVVTDLLKLITSLHETLKRKYCAAQQGLCIVQPVEHIVVTLRPVQSRFVHEIETHHRIQQQKLKDIAEKEEEAILEERQQREEEMARLRVEIREKWLRLHEERKHVDKDILKRKELIHLSVPELEPDIDGNGEPFERVEIFAPRIGPSMASTEKARQVEWTGEELQALRSGLEEFAGKSLFMKIFRRYCRPGRPLNRFNVTEIVTVAADMRQYEENEQRRRKNGQVDEWVRVVKPYMWTKPKILESGQENYFGDD